MAGLFVVDAVADIGAMKLIDAANSDITMVLSRTLTFMMIPFLVRQNAESFASFGANGVTVFLDRFYAL